MNLKTYGPLGLWLAALCFDLRILADHLPRVQVDCLALGMVLTGTAGTAWAAWLTHIDIQARCRRRLEELEHRAGALARQHAVERALLLQLREEMRHGP